MYCHLDEALHYLSLMSSMHGLATRSLGKATCNIYFIMGVLDLLSASHLYTTKSYMVEIKHFPILKSSLHPVQFCSATYVYAVVLKRLVQTLMFWNYLCRSAVGISKDTCYIQRATL